MSRGTPQFATAQGEEMIAKSGMAVNAIAYVPISVDHE
jgi:hypothetical protein